MLTYSEFTSTVPKKTSEILGDIMPYVKHYMSENNRIEISNSNADISGFNKNMIFLLLYWMSLEEPYIEFFSKYQFSRDSIVIDGYDLSGTPESIYNDVVGIFPDYKDKTRYITMTPLDILIPRFKGLSESSAEVLKKVFKNYPGYNQFLRDLEELNASIKQNYYRQIEERLYGNLSISVISFFETAANVRSILIEKDGIPQKFLSSDADVTPLSLLIAAFFYNDDSSNSEISFKDAIIKYLESKGVTREKLLKLVSFTYKTVDENNVAAIQTEFLKYAKKGVNENRDEHLVTVASILENVFNRQFTGSLIIEKIMNELECKISDIQGFEANVNDMHNKLVKEESYNYIKDFYMKLSKEVKEFIDYATKIYSLLLRKMNEQSYKSPYLTCEDDADTLAIFIAAYHFNGDVATFYQDHGIDLGKIYALLKITITDKEIEETPVDEKILVDRFKRFVADGVNNQKSLSSTSVNDIIHNLCDRTFNRSMIMESIYTELTHDFDIKPNFLNQMLKYLEQKEKEQKETLKENLFVDLSVSTIDYLESVAKIHTLLRRENALLEWSDEDLRPISIILATFSSQDEILKKFIGDLGFKSLDNVCSKLSVNIREITNKNVPFDINVLHDEYDQYIFGGVNKDKERSSIDIYSIVKNAFNRDLNNHVNVTKFLAIFGLENDTFDHLDKLHKDFQDRERMKELDREAESRLKSQFIYEDGQYDAFISPYLDNVFAIYTMIKDAIKKGDIDTDLVNSTNDMIVLSFFLGHKDAEPKYMKPPFTFENIFKTLNIRFNQGEKPKIDYVAMEKIFGTYLTPFVGTARYPSDIINALISRGSGDIVIKRLCDKLEYDYDVLKVEIITGKSYDETLSIDDRIKMLSDEDVEVIDPDSVQSILDFGSGLVVHSKYIHDTLPKLVLNDNLEVSTKEINEALGNIYERRVPERPKSILERFFGTEVPEEAEVVINPAAVEELKDKIGYSVDVLKKELILYDEIKRYIEAYRQKNKEHYLVATKAVEEIRARLEKLDPSKEEEYSQYLSVSTALQVMQDKETRFAMTNQLMQQELLRVSQAIVSHFMTINALEMARDDMLPLVGSELAIGKGLDTEKSALELSKGIIDLFQSMLSRNVEDTLSNIQQLQASTLSGPVLDVINKDITSYLDHLRKMQEMESQVTMALDSDDLKEAIEKPTELKL